MWFRSESVTHYLSSLTPGRCAQVCFVKPEASSSPSAIFIHTWVLSECSPYIQYIWYINGDIIMVIMLRVLYCYHTKQRLLGNNTCQGRSSPSLFPYVKIHIILWPHTQRTGNINYYFIAVLIFSSNQSRHYCWHTAVLKGNCSL